MNIKEEIINNINRLEIGDYDQTIHGKNHYYNLSRLVCNLLNVGFTEEEVIKLIDDVNISWKDKGMVYRWRKSMKKLNPANSLWYFKKLLNCNFEGIEIPKQKVDVFEQLTKVKTKNDYRKFHSKLKEFLSDYELKHIKNNSKTFENIGEFFRSIFPDIDKDKDMIGIACNQNDSKHSYFNECKIQNNSKDSLEKYTHFILNRPYIRDKEKFEGVAETDIFDARYMLIEVDEGLSIEEQIKIADLLIENGVPVKMVTHSGSKSVHVLIDLKIRVLEKLKKMNLISGKHKLTNYCNIELNQLIKGFPLKQIEEFFGTNSANDFYKEHVKSIYDILTSIGIQPDNSCKNLNRWTRIPQGIRVKDGKSISQKLIYFREENSECIDTKGSIENFVKNTKKQIESAYDSLFEI